MNKSEIARKYRDIHGMEVPTKQLARIMYKENDILFYDLEDARDTLRRIEGKKGNGGDGTKITHKYPERPRNPYNLPVSFQEKREPFVLPKACNNILLISDLHIPYHDIDAITIALKYGKKKKVNTILINGDLIDCHHGSKFESDPKKRSFKEEFDATKQFLVSLRQLFPNAEIYWLKGNHCIRWEKFLLRKVREIFDDSYFQLENRLRLNEERIHLLDDKVLVKAGKLSITHGHHIFKGIFSPVSPARGAYMKAKQSVIVGHLHRASHHPEIDLDGNVVSCWSTGCLCHDEKTEILTEIGFVNFSKYHEGLKIAEFDPIDKSIKYRNPLAVQRYLYQGDLFNFSSKWVDQLVTPDHKMLVTRDGLNIICSAEQLYNRKRNLNLFTNGLVEKSGIEKDYLFGELLGFIITDGSYRSESNGIVIYQKNKFQRLKNILDALGVEYKIRKNRDIPVFYISAKSDFSKTIREINPIKNQISRYALDQKFEFLYGLYEGLIAGDGHRRKNNNKTDYFSTHNYETALQFQELCCKIGYSCTIKKYEGVGNNITNKAWYMYKCHVRKTNISLIKNKAIVPYNGMVYDVTTTSGFFVIRRNGKVSISGNCELRPDYSPLVSNSQHGFAHITVEDNGQYHVRNFQIIKGKLY